MIPLTLKDEHRIQLITEGAYRVVYEHVAAEIRSQLQELIEPQVQELARMAVRHVELAQHLEKDFRSKGYNVNIQVRIKE